MIFSSIFKLQMEKKIKIFQEQYDIDELSLFTEKNENMVLIGR